MSSRDYRPSEPRHIGDVLSQLIVRRGYARVQSAGAFGEAWVQVAGERWAKSTRAVGVKRGVLEVLVTSSTLAQELGFEKRNLIKKLTSLLPDEKIRDVKFRVGSLT